MASYSEWQWSAEHRRYYCAVYDTQGRVVEYQWQGGHRQPVVQSPSAPYSQSSLQAPHTAPPPSSSTEIPRSLQQGPASENVNENTQGASTTSSPPNTAATLASQYKTSYETYAQASNAYYTTTPQPQTHHASRGQSTHYASSSQTQPHSAYSQFNSASSLPQEVKEVVGDKAQRFIQTQSTERPDERLSNQYRRVPPHYQEHFFCRGRVFKMLWTEPAGTTVQGGTRGSTHYSVVWLGEGVYSEIRRFVVVQNKGTFSQCIPVQTYRKQGATKEGLVVADHAIIYTGYYGELPPSTLAGEYLTKVPLRVTPSKNEVLDKESRINFGKPYAVEHNVKVVEIGMIGDEHMHNLVHYFTQAVIPS